MSSQLDSYEKQPTEKHHVDTQDGSSSSLNGHTQGEEQSKQEAQAGNVEAQIDAVSIITAGSHIPPPPDGGLHAWLKVFGGFMIYINIWLALRFSYTFCSMY